MNAVANNTDALKERFVINHHMNGSGVTGEDGYWKGAHTGPAWSYQKSAGKYFTFFLDGNNFTSIHLYVSSTTAAPTASQGGILRVQ